MESKYIWYTVAACVVLFFLWIIWGKVTKKKHTNYISRVRAEQDRDFDSRMAKIKSSPIQQEFARRQLDLRAAIEAELRSKK